MTEYARVDHDRVTAFENLDVMPVFEAGKPKAAYRRFLPVRWSRPAWNARMEARDEIPLPDPVPANATEIVRGWTVRPMTAQEREDMKQAELGSFDDRAVRAFVMWTVNKFRAAEGKQPLTWLQIRQAMYDELDGAQ